MDLMTATPKLTGDVQKDIKNLSNHVFQLEEHLRYQLRNLDVTNFNDLGLARYENGRLQVYAKAVEVHTKDLEVRLENTEKTVSSLDETAGGLQNEVATIKATSEEIRTEVSAVEKSLGAQISGLQDQQFKDYLYLDGKIDTKVTELNSTISQTAQKIRSEVSASLESVNGEIEDVRSSITQTAGEIRLEVSTVSGELETLSGEVIKIDERQEALYDVYKDEQDLNYNRYVALSSEIVQNQNRIALVVKKENGSNVVDAASIVAAINEAGSEVKIAADHVTVDASSFVVDGVISGIEIGTSYTGALSGNIVIKNEEISFMDTDPTLPYYNRKEISKISAYYDEGDSASAGLMIGSQNRITVLSDEEILLSVYDKDERKSTQWSFLDGAIHSTGNMILSSEDFVRIKCPDGGYWSIEEDGFYKVDPYGNRVLYMPAYPT